VGIYRTGQNQPSSRIYQFLVLAYGWVEERLLFQMQVKCVEDYKPLLQHELFKRLSTIVLLLNYLKFCNVFLKLVKE
jgi:hypothetical protein